MKLLFITHKFYPDIGGIEVNSEVLASHFHNAGVEIQLVTWTQDTGTKTFSFPVVRHPNVSLLLKLHRWADVVYENNPCLRLAWPNILFKKPDVVALRTWINRMDGKRGWQDKLKVLWLNHAAGVIAISEAVRKRSWEQAIVIGNPYRAELFKTLAYSSRDTDFVFLGRLVSDKGADLAIRAFSLFLEPYKEKGQMPSSCKLTIIGDGPERQNLEELAFSLSLTDRVQFTGVLRGEELVKALNRHRYLLVPSLWDEPFGNVALEGMACGCIPIVSDGGGLSDAVGGAGIVFKKGSVTALVAAINDIYPDEAIQYSLLSQAKKHLATHHPSAVSAAYLQVIRNAFKING